MSKNPNVIYVYCDAGQGHARRHPEPIAHVFAPPTEPGEGWQSRIESQRLRDEHGMVAPVRTVLVGNRKYDFATDQGAEIRDTITITCSAARCSRTMTAKGERLDDVLNGLAHLGIDRISMRSFESLLSRHGAI